MTKLKPEAEMQQLESEFPPVSSIAFTAARQL